MHLLFVTSIVPDGSLGSGYEIANEAIVDALRRTGARVTVMGFAWPGRRPADSRDTIVLGEVDVRTDTASSLRKVIWLAEAMSTGLTFSSAKLRCIPRRAVRDAIRSAGPVDGYILNSVQFAGAFEDCFDDRPSIFVAHNVEAKSAAENAETSRDPFQRLLFRREAQLMKGLEERLCRRARFVYTLSEDDRAALGVSSDARSAALPLVTRKSVPKPGARPPIACDAALIGTWTWQPNRVGLEWFLERVMRHVPETFRVRIAGNVPADVEARHPGVSFVGRVPDAAEFVRAAAVVPLVSRGGTGVQLKTIETFELGLPAVATSSALRGIAHRPANCVVADDPKTFAEAMVAAARHPLPAEDGTAFHAAQQAALDRQIRKGLQGMVATGREVTA
jgi:hypothetical protein